MYKLICVGRAMAYGALLSEHWMHIGAELAIAAYGALVLLDLLHLLFIREPAPPENRSVKDHDDE